VPSPIPLDPGPLGGRFQAATAAVGDELVVFGGFESSMTGHDDGAAYDTVAGTWRPLPSSGGLAEGATAALATEGERVVFAGPGGVARLDVGAGTWQPLESSPFAAGRFVVAGDGLYVVEEAYPLEQVGIARLDPSTGAWDPLPPVAGSFVVDLHSVGGTLVAITQPPTEATDRAAFALDGDGWRDLAMPALDWMFGSISTVAAGRLLVWSGEAFAAPDRLNDHGLAFEVAAGAWEEIEGLPGDWWECYATATPWGDLLLLDVCGVTALFDPAAGTVVATDGLEGDELSSAPWRTVADGVYRWGERQCYGDCEDPPALVFQRWG
jgi:hypothetical protein